MDNFTIYGVEKSDGSYEPGGPTGPGAPCYHVMEDEYLRSRCKFLGLLGYQNMTRVEMIDALKEIDEKNWKEWRKAWKDAPNGDPGPNGIVV
jgi:hypothetical protein